MCQIVLQERAKDGSGKNTYITQISTGNYNEKTAKNYTDLSLITYNQKIGKAASRLFRDICKDRVGLKGSDYAPLVVSPSDMRSELLRLIHREARKGSEGLIVLKINSLTDAEMIEALMEASCAGCSVRMIVRGICCLLPGVEGCTENICIVNKVGRFLEHSRVYIFGSGEDEIMFISSADLMKRNLDRRVEAACPVNDRRIRERIRRIIYDVYCDTEKGRVMMPDGSYAKKPE
jgi:polyphosphate kinase